jgi:toxin ParE1/3/4
LKPSGWAPGVRKRLSFSRRATADLDNIWDYGELHWGREQADRYASEMTARCNAIVEGSLVTQEIMLKNGRFLRMRSGSHFILLRELPDRLQVVRVLHERQDFEAALE